MSSNQWLESHPDFIFPCVKPEIKLALSKIEGILGCAYGRLNKVTIFINNNLTIDDIIKKVEEQNPQLPKGQQSWIYMIHLPKQTITEETKN